MLAYPDSLESKVSLRYIRPRGRCVMSDEAKPVRSWQEIAEEASHEHDPEKLDSLSIELARALDERAKRLHPQGIPHKE